MKKLGIGTVIIAAFMVLFIFFAASFVLMTLVNVVLTQYGAENLEFFSAMAIVAMLGIFGGALRGSQSE